MHRVVRLAAGPAFDVVAGLAALALPAAPATAASFHLAQNGVCNKTDKPVEDVWVAIQACEGDDCRCKVTQSDGAGTYGNEVTLAPGACGTATFELGDGCSGLAMVFVDPDDVVQCSFRLSVSPTGNKTIENAGCRQGQDFILEPHDGDEHFQLDIQPKS
jgi:hypothetical protein